MKTNYEDEDEGEGFRKHVKTGDEKTRAKRTRGQGGGMTEEGGKEG